MTFLLIFISLMSLASPEDMLLIQKQCRQTYKVNSKNICLCLKDNLQKKLSNRQIKELAKIYKNRAARISASKDSSKKSLLDIDYEVHHNCGITPDWRWIPEDLGTPDPL